MRGAVGLSLARGARLVRVEGGHPEDDGADQRGDDGERREYAPGELDAGGTFSWGRGHIATEAVRLGDEGERNRLSPAEHRAPSRVVGSPGPL
ncbi:hypothetical protein GCM10009753_74320 [Streptantibioticus ferralitis]